MRITDYAFVEVGEQEINENLGSKIDHRNIRPGAIGSF
jgi:hypothetical protein